jgi:hypothetical protein
MQTQRQADPAKLARIAIMTLNFSSMLKTPQNPNGTIDILDIGQMYADMYGVRNIEMQHSHFLSTEESWLRELKARYDRTQSRVTNINLEFGAMTISAADPSLRVQAIDLTKRWADHAALVGCPRIMINQGQLSHANKGWSVDALKLMVDYGKTKNVMVSVETRGNGGGGGRAAATPLGAGAATPPAANPVAAATPAAGAPAAPAAGARAGGAGQGRGNAAPPPLTVIPGWVLLSEVIRDAGSWSNVDMGGVGAQDQGELHAALRTLLPMTVGSMHTRVSGNWDLATCIRFCSQHLQYKGLYSIETNGHEATKNIYNVILDTLTV